jgi:hypothetical protein
MSTTGYAALRALGETQLQIQFALFSAYDARAIGALAVDSALAALATAAADPIGRLWWLSLVGLLVACLPCVFALVFRGGSMALGVDTILDAVAERNGDLTNQLLIAAIAAAVASNEELLQSKLDLVSGSILLIGITIFSVIVGTLVS